MGMNVWNRLADISKAGSRFTDDELADMLDIIQTVFAEEEASIPAGVEDQEMQKIEGKLLGAGKRARKARKKM